MTQTTFAIHLCNDIIITDNSHSACIVAGGLAVPGTAGGQFLGGLACKVFKLKVRGMLKFCIGLALCSVLLAACTLANCGAKNVAGVSTTYITGQEKE